MKTGPRSPPPERRRRPTFQITLTRPGWPFHRNHTSLSCCRKVAVWPLIGRPTSASSPPFDRLHHHHLFGNLDSTNGPQGLLEVAVDGELTGGQGADHEETGTETGVRAAEAELLGDLDQTRRRALAGSALSLVDLAGGGASVS